MGFKGDLGRFRGLIGGKRGARGILKKGKRDEKGYFAGV